MSELNYDGAREKNTTPTLKVVDGSYRFEVPKGTDGSVEREWEAGGNSGVKYEKVIGEVRGTIKTIVIFEGETEDERKFRLLNITLENDKGQEVRLSHGLETGYASDILEKLPNIDLKEEVIFQPSNKDKKARMWIKQGVGDDGKPKNVQSFFSAWNDKKKKYDHFNGMPAPDKDLKKGDSDGWKIYFTQRRIFLKKYFEENFAPQFTSTVSKPEVDEDNIPF
jgi:hypothetical protein